MRLFFAPGRCADHSSPRVPAVAKEQMNHSAVREKLAQALRLQYRSVLQYTVTAGSIVGMEY